jgi:hypothetical protein
MFALQGDEPVERRVGQAAALFESLGQHDEAV